MKGLASARERGISPGRIRKEHARWLEQHGLPSKARAKASVAGSFVRAGKGKDSGTMDPTLGTREPCLMFKERGRCRFGGACKFAHVTG